MQQILIMNLYKRTTWKPILEKVHAKRAKAQEQAEKMGEKLGHFLDAWTTMNNCTCRKCGAYAKINGVYGSDEKVSFYGSAFSNPCNVNFNNVNDYEFEAYSNPSHEKALV